VPERTPTPQPVDPTPGAQPPPVGQREGAAEIADRIVEVATNVQGVDSAAAVVVGNVALVGITLERDAARNQDEIKREISRLVEVQEPGIVNAFVSANPDIFKQLQDISGRMQRDEPIDTFFDEIMDIFERMRAETAD
jgi:YhcN/YlaJ family sporulation lipoprotein